MRVKKKKLSEIWKKKNVYIRLKKKSLPKTKKGKKGLPGIKEKMCT